MILVTGAEGKPVSVTGAMGFLGGMERKCRKRGEANRLNKVFGYSADDTVKAIKGSKPLKTLGVCS